MTSRASRLRPWYPFLGALGIGALAWVIGVHLPHALLLTGLVAALTLVVSVLDVGSQTTWPGLGFGRRDGARRDVSTLTWSMLDGTGGLSGVGAARLHRALTETLRLTRTDATSRRATELFGPRVARWLTEPPGTENPPPDRATARRAMATAETLLRTPPTREGAHVHPR
ncbi:hypothetical protein [Ruania alba]|uniref:Uncharacterized protein n=1 Tax=Ruania alba TaxID=648782 RepID=A0A1H5CXX5_9MICO|nr:hypothetical protein [Ruania alba]SED71298.1 hypothetical protein SAMN04488554_0503 [Ruania alba]